MASPAYISVESRTGEPPGAEGGHDEHIVQAGETLYSIAASYRQSVLELAENNAMLTPYTIYPGQYLYVGRSKQQAASSVYRTTAATAYAVETASKVAIRKVTKKSIKKTVVSTSHRSPTVVESPELNKKRTVSNNHSLGSVDKNGSWQWPISGQLIFPLSKGGDSCEGIAISGDMGESVVATAAGEVVYSGAGLAGYGNLIIIRHNSRYLSAYEHNLSLLVDEGEQVKAGQQIAELGSAGTNEPKLHFEIRRNGKPVDPLLFLPNR